MSEQTGRSHSKYERIKDSKGRDIPNWKKDASTGKLIWEGRLNGRSRKITFDTTKLNEARAQFPSRAAEVSGQKKDEKKIQKQVLFRDIFAKVKEQKEIHERRGATMVKFESVWRNSLEPFWGDLTPAEFTEANMQEFIVWHRKNRRNKKTGEPVQLFNAFKYLTNLATYMVRFGYMAQKDVPEIELPKKEKQQLAKQKGREVTPEEVTSIVAKADPETRLQVGLGYTTGMRKMEIGAMRLDVIEFRPNSPGAKAVIKLDIDDTKTGLPRIVPVAEYLIPAFRAQYEVAQAKKSPYLFPMKSDSSRHTYGQLIDKGWNAAKHAAKMVGSKRIRFHDLRHTAATNMARANVNPIVAATTLGMAIARYQKTYLKLTADDLMIAVDAAPVKLFIPATDTGAA